MKATDAPCPKLACKCNAVLVPEQRIRTSYRRCDRPGMSDWKVLERKYHCPRCGWRVWHEVAAKAPEEGVL
jgi:hypothetical protein